LHDYLRFLVLINVEHPTGVMGGHSIQNYQAYIPPILPIGSFCPTLDAGHSSAAHASQVSVDEFHPTAITRDLNLFKSSVRGHITWTVINQEMTVDIRV